MKIREGRLHFAGGEEILLKPGDGVIPVTVTAPEDGEAAVCSAACLLFGSERDPRFTDGSIDWEYRGMRVLAEKDFSRLPAQARFSLIEEERIRRIPSDELPLPEGLTAETLESLLHIGKTPRDCRTRILNLLGSGNENCDAASALKTAKAEAASLRQQLRPDAEKQLAAVEAELKELESRDLSGDAVSENCEDMKAELALLESGVQELSDACSAADRDLKRKESVLTHLGGKDKAKVEEDLECAEKLCAQLKTYDENYRGEKLSAGILSALSLLLVLVAFGCLYYMNRSIQAGIYLPVAVLFIVAILAATFFTRFSRRADAIDADKKNRALLKEMLAEYLPDYSPKGTLKEATELKDYLGKVRELFGYLAGRRAELTEKSLKLQELEEKRVALKDKLEQQQILKVKRERWEFLLRDAENRRRILEPQVRENARLLREICVRETAAAQLEQLIEDFQLNFCPALLKETEEILRVLSAGNFEGLILTDPASLFAVKDHRQLPLELLPEDGTALLYLALRLALIRKTWPEEAMPLFLDAGFCCPGPEELLPDRIKSIYAGQIFLFC